VIPKSRKLRSLVGAALNDAFWQDLSVTHSTSSSDPIYHDCVNAMVSRRKPRSTPMRYAMWKMGYLGKMVCHLLHWPRA
jgi:hypothetical protein